MAEINLTHRLATPPCAHATIDNGILKVSLVSTGSISVSLNDVRLFVTDRAIELVFVTPDQIMSYSAPRVTDASDAGFAALRERAKEILIYPMAARFLGMLCASLFCLPILIILVVALIPGTLSGASTVGYACIVGTLLLALTANIASTMAVYYTKDVLWAAACVGQVSDIYAGIIPKWEARLVELLSRRVVMTAGGISTIVTLVVGSYLLTSYVPEDQWRVNNSPLAWTYFAFAGITSGLSFIFVCAWIACNCMANLWSLWMLEADHFRSSVRGELSLSQLRYEHVILLAATPWLAMGVVVLLLLPSNGSAGAQISVIDLKWI